MNEDIDIVARLRHRYGSLSIPAEAATEIERLREEYALWKMTAEHLARQLGKMEYADAAYQDIVDSIKRADEVLGDR